MAWFFTVVFFLGTEQQAAPMAIGGFATQQACETQRLLMTTKMSAAHATPCTRERVHAGQHVVG